MTLMTGVASYGALGHVPPPLNIQLFNLSGHFRGAQSMKWSLLWLPTQKRIYRPIAVCYCSLHEFHNILCVTLKFFYLPFMPFLAPNSGDAIVEVRDETETLLGRDRDYTYMAGLVDGRRGWSCTTSSHCLEKRAGWRFSRWIQATVRQHLLQRQACFHLHNRHPWRRHASYGALGHTPADFQLFNLSGHFRDIQTLTFDPV